MARKIVDKLVMDKLVGAAYLDCVSNPDFAGNVNTTKNTFQIKRTKMGLPKIDPLEQFQQNYNGICIQDSPDNCTLAMELNGEQRERTISVKELKFLKALVIEQVNECNAYSEVVANIFWAYVVKLMTYNSIDETTPSDQDAPLAQILKSMFIDFRAREGISA